MKLIVQIPCYNESDTLPQTLEAIPRSIEGVDEVEILVIDDGSSDGTSDLARSLGVEHVIVHKSNCGLARAFKSGIDKAVLLGADIIVNTDGDNQYPGNQIPDLIAPILRGDADLVIGDRQTGSLRHFSPIKKVLQKIGSFAIRRLTGTNVPDAVSGFRAMSREAAIQFNVLSPFSYTIETLIQSGQRRMATTSVPIIANAPTRPSRLFKNIPQFLANSILTILRIYTMYHPLRFFWSLTAILMLIGIIPIVRFLYYFATGDGDGHIQSLVLGGAFLVMGFITFVSSLIADLINFNRKLIEETLERVTRIEVASRGHAGEKK